MDFVQMYPLRERSLGLSNRAECLAVSATYRAIYYSSDGTQIVGNGCAKGDVHIVGNCVTICAIFQTGS